VHMVFASRSICYCLVRRNLFRERALASYSTGPSTSDISRRINDIFQSHSAEELRDLSLKARVLADCMEAFAVPVPSVHLSKLRTKEDLVTYFSEQLTPKPLPAPIDLPPNLEIGVKLQKPVRPKLSKSSRSQ